MIRASNSWVWVVVLGTAAAQPVRDYHLDRPHQTFTLPEKLEEVSGLCTLGPTRIGMVQDERGVLYEFDLGKGRVVARRKFGKRGDYEGITMVGDDPWVLRSDGALLQLTRDGGGIARVVELKSGHKDLEGLAYDPRRKLLLIAPKDRAQRQKKHMRPLLGFDPHALRQVPEPVLDLDLDTLAAAALDKGLRMPMKTNRKGKRVPDYEPKFSGVAVHPKTGAIYLLSTLEVGLLVVDDKGALLDFQLLDRDALPQPEGITFLPDGTLVIASEADGRAPVLQVFHYRKPPPEPPPEKRAPQRAGGKRVSALGLGVGLGVGMGAVGVVAVVLSARRRG